MIYPTVPLVKISQESFSGLIIDCSIVHFALLGTIVISALVLFPLRLLIIRGIRVTITTINRIFLSLIIPVITRTVVIFLFGSWVRIILLSLIQSWRMMRTGPAVYTFVVIFDWVRSLIRIVPIQPLC